LRPKSPCKECSGRELRCHSHCERYKQFREELKRYTEARREEVWDEYTDYVYVQVKRGSRRGGKAN
jgi:hypothetical protein